MKSLTNFINEQLDDVYCIINESKDITFPTFNKPGDIVDWCISQGYWKHGTPGKKEFSSENKRHPLWFYTNYKGKHVWMLFHELWIRNSTTGLCEFDSAHIFMSPNNKPPRIFKKVNVDWKDEGWTTGEVALFLPREEGGVVELNKLAVDEYFGKPMPKMSGSPEAVVQSLDGFIKELASGGDGWKLVKIASV